ncbi:MAG: hypothetical protein KC435_01365 [Thermomicrobiales bacterium]|nr:hypothetical protein [Thermomicrobiales bacterium]
MDTSNPTVETTQTSVHPMRLIVFAVMAVGFFVWVAFGTIQARVWVQGQLNLLDRRIAAMWQYLGNNLPQTPAPALFEMIYWLSISFVVVGTIIGLWLFLGTPDDDPHDESWEAIHAAHLADDAQ